MGQVRHNQSGYVGSSRSVRAAEAEREGRLPLTRAIQALRVQAGCTAKVARAALAAVGPCEWHHTSRYARQTDYYHVGAARAYLELEPVLSLLASESVEIEAALAQHLRSDAKLADRLAAAEPIWERIARQAGATTELVRCVFYDDWSGAAAQLGYE